MIEVAVDTPSGRYQVVVAPDHVGLSHALQGAFGGPVPRAVLVTDANVGPRWAEAVKHALPGMALTEVQLPAGEAHKTLDTWSWLVTRLLEAGVDRHTPVLALGGGVVGDVAGFAAACTMRGVPFVQLPTTLLAMVDASVGGKTGVNHPHGKNLVGAFHQPRLVWAALSTLSTLPEQEHTSGLGEVLKTALVGAPELLDTLGGPGLDLAGTVARCVGVKARIVAEDEREAGVRVVLNAGHTVGHALETALGHGGIPHGHAVAIGLVEEARFAVAQGVCEESGLPDRIADVAARLGLPVTLPDVDDDALLAAVRFDKKGAADTLQVPLPVRRGVYTRVPVPWTQVAGLWKSGTP